MKKKTAVVSLILGTAAALALSGCGAMTPEKLADKVKKAVEETPYSQMELDLTADMAIGDPTTGIEMDVGIQMDGQIRVSYDPDTMYENLNMTMEMMGVRLPINVEVYILPEDSEMVTYTYTDLDGRWLRQGTGSSDQIGDNRSLALWAMPNENFTIDEEVTELEGTEVICLNGTITGEEVSKALGSLLSGLEESGSLLDEGMLMEEEDLTGLDGIDWEKVSAQVTAYVDAKTYLPLRDEFSFSGLDEALNDIVRESGATLGIHQVEMSVDYTSYDPVDPCALPEGAKEQAAQNERLLGGNPDNGDGTFTIQEGGYYADILAPEGYELAYTNYDEVDFYSEELDRLVCYQMWTNDDRNDFFFWDMVDQAAYEYTGDMFGPERMASIEIVDTANFSFALDGFSYQGDYAGYNYYAWTNMDEEYYSWVLVSIYDGGDAMDSTITREEVQSLLGQVSPYQLPAAQEDDIEKILDQLEL